MKSVYKTKKIFQKVHDEPNYSSTSLQNEAIQRCNLYIVSTLFKQEKINTIFHCSMCQRPAGPSLHLSTILLPITTPSCWTKLSCIQYHPPIEKKKKRIKAIGKKLPKPCPHQLIFPVVAAPQSRRTESNCSRKREQ